MPDPNPHEIAIEIAIFLSQAVKDEIEFLQKHNVHLHYDSKEKLDICRVFDRICQEHTLRYLLIKQISQKLDKNYKIAVEAIKRFDLILLINEVKFIFEIKRWVEDIPLAQIVQKDLKKLRQYKSSHKCYCYELIYTSNYKDDLQEKAQNLHKHYLEEFQKRSEDYEERMELIEPPIMRESGGYCCCVYLVEPVELI